MSHSLPSTSSGRYGKTVSWASSVRGEDDDLVHESSGYPTRPTSTTGESRTQFMGPRYPIPPSEAPPTILDSVMPRSRQELILRLSEKEVDELLKPVHQGIISPSTVFDVCDLQSDVSMAVNAGDMMEILERHGRGSTLSNDYESISIQNDTWDERRQRIGRKCFGIFTTVAIILILVVSVTVYILAYGRKKDNTPPEDFGSIYLFGGAGGKDPNQTLSSVQIYSPFNSAKTSMPKWLNFPSGQQRDGHVAGVLANGIVCIAGGSSKGNFTYAVRSTLLFNRTDKVQPYREGPQLIEKRFLAAAAVLNGRLYICGGWSFRNSCEYLENNASNYSQWREGVPMLLGRHVHAMTSLNDQLYVIGGYNTNNNEKFLPQVERFNPVTQNWTQVARLKYITRYGRSNLAAATFEGKIIVCGGEASVPRILPCERYDSALNKWSEIAANNALRDWPAMVVVEKFLYVLAGQGQKSVERYLKTQDKWETLELELEVYRQFTAAVGFPSTI